MGHQVNAQEDTYCSLSLLLLHSIPSLFSAAAAVDNVDAGSSRTSNGECSGTQTQMAMTISVIMCEINAGNGTTTDGKEEENPFFLQLL